jgi:hypothetical protein
MDIKQFIKENQEEILTYITELLIEKKKQKHAPSVKLKFVALGKSYISDKSIKNYVNFIKDLSNIHPYETFEPIMKSFIAKTEYDFSEDHKPHAIKINNDFYLSKKIGNNIKERHITKISETLNIPITLVME